MSRLRFQNTTVVIVDAGSDFGHHCATSFASRGADLVANFPPRLGDDSGAVRQASALLLKRIQDAGGKAVVTFEEAYHGDRVVEAAIAEYNSVHVLISNATFRTEVRSDALKDAATWELMWRTNIKGSFKCLKAAWPHFRKQAYGRVIFVDSTPAEAGIAESAARFGTIGFSETLAREGAKYNTTVNYVACKALSFLSRVDVAPETRGASTQLAALAVSLSDKSSNAVSGKIFECGDGEVSALRWERAGGVLLNPDEGFNASALLTRLTDMDDFSESTQPTGSADFAKVLPRARSLPRAAPGPALHFEGKVVIVTGGGAGLGRCYALGFAELGASVFVNDKIDPNKVVQEIKMKGGKASGITASVEDGETVVKAAIKTYGHVDILVNNAGFVRDKAFVNMDESTWDAILNVHLRGTYEMTRAIWPYFRQQGFGRIVNTTSTSGIYGNFGQSNYSMAKLAILGLSEATAREGRQHSINVNTIAPVASTGGLATALSGTADADQKTVFKPEYNVPIVLLLCLGEIPGRQQSTGGLFEVGCGWQARTRLQRSEGFTISTDQELSPESVLQSWEKVMKYSDADGSKSFQSNGTRYLQKIEKLKSQDIRGVDYRYADKDVILYNLTAGARRKDLALIYEGAKNFQALPTFGIMPFFSQSNMDANSEVVPNFTPALSLLGEHYLEIFQYPIPTSGELTSRRRLVEVLDKGNAAISINGHTTIDIGTGAKLFYNEMSFFMRGSGGFGGPKAREDGGRAARTYTMPSTTPDAIAEYKTSEEQAALYRLTGDRMPIHIDPEFSRKGGHPVPILHGDCFMGIAGKHVFDHYGRYRSIKVRYVGTVIPGQTLRTEMWRDKNERDLVKFQTRVLETGKLCIGGGGAHLWEPTSPTARL